MISAYQKQGERFVEIIFLGINLLGRNFHAHFPFLRLNKSRKCKHSCIGQPGKYAANNQKPD